MSWVGALLGAAKKRAPASVIACIQRLGNSTFTSRIVAGRGRCLALAGERMPEKSTYFYPKVPTGLVFNPLD